MAAGWTAFDLESTLTDLPLSTLNSFACFFGNFLGWIFTNTKEDSVATKVDFGGEFDDVSVGIWPAVGATFRHAFIKALPEKLENTIKLKTLKATKRK